MTMTTTPARTQATGELVETLTTLVERSGGWHRDERGHCSVCGNQWPCWTAQACIAMSASIAALTTATSRADALTERVRELERSIGYARECPEDQHTATLTISYRGTTWVLDKGVTPTAGTIIAWRKRIDAALGGPLPVRATPPTPDGGAVEG